MHGSRQAHIAHLGVPPHLLQKRLLLEHAACMANKGEQQTPLQGRERDGRGSQRQVTIAIKAIGPKGPTRGAWLMGRAHGHGGAGDSRWARGWMQRIVGVVSQQAGVHWSGVGWAKRCAWEGIHAIDMDCGPWVAIVMLK